MNQSGPLQLIAHRGNALEYPENTLPAFASALDLGVRLLELDVHLSADAVPVVIHDHELMRTTGEGGTVFDLRWSELARLSAGEPQRFGERFRGTRIPQLTDVLALLQSRSEVTLFVEIKRASLIRFGHEQVLARVLDTLRPAQAQCVVISFDLAAVRRARELGGVSIGWVLPQYDVPSRLECEALQPQFLFCDHEQLPPSGALWPGPWRWAIYEVESLPLALSLNERGALYIETMAVNAMTAAMHALDDGAPAPRPGA